MVVRAPSIRHTHLHTVSLCYTTLLTPILGNMSIMPLACAVLVLECRRSLHQAKAVAPVSQHPKLPLVIILISAFIGLASTAALTLFAGLALSLAINPFLQVSSLVCWAIVNDAAPARDIGIKGPEPRWLRISWLMSGLLLPILLRSAWSLDPEAPYSVLVTLAVTGFFLVISKHHPSSCGPPLLIEGLLIHAVIADLASQIPVISLNDPSFVVSYLLMSAVALLVLWSWSHASSKSPSVSITSEKTSPGNMPLVHGPHHTQTALDDSPSNTVLIANALVAARCEGSQPSQREYEVLIAALEGKTSAETARELSIAPGTVDTMRSRLYRKLDVANKRELLRIAQETSVSTSLKTDDTHPDETPETPPTPETVKPHVYSATNHPRSPLLASALFAITCALMLFVPPASLRIGTSFISEFRVFAISAAALPYLCCGATTAAFRGAKKDLPRSERSPSGTARREGIRLLFAICEAAIIASKWERNAWEYAVPCVLLLACTVLALGKTAIGLKGPKASSTQGTAHKGLRPLCTNLLGGIYAVGESTAPILGAVLLLAQNMEHLISAHIDLAFVSLWTLASLLAGLCFAEMADRRTAEQVKQPDAFDWLCSRGFGTLQAQVLLEAANGSSIEETATRLTVAGTTVRAYLRRGYSKLGIHDVAGLRSLLSQNSTYASPTHQKCAEL